MGYLIHILDYDWESPAKTAARRSASAVSLVSRLGRCLTVPAARGGRAGGGEACDGGDASASPGGGGRRGRSGSRERAGAGGNGSGAGSAGASGHGGRRTFGLRRGEEEGLGNGQAGRVRIDGSPAPLPSVNAQHGSGSSSRNRKRIGGGGGAGRGGSPGAGPAPDERFVEVLCKGLAIDAEMSLATVRDFVWKASGTELVLTYRRAKQRTPSPSSPAPPPPLLPGGANNSAMAGAAATSAASPSGTGGSDDQMNEDVTSELNGAGPDGALSAGQVAAGNRGNELSGEPSPERPEPK